MAKPDGSTLTLTCETSVNGVATEPEAALILNHEPPEVVAFQVMVPCPALNTPNVRGNGAPPAATPEKVNPA
jgi:hypothetical protein